MVIQIQENVKLAQIIIKKLEVQYDAENSIMLSIIIEHFGE